MRIPKDISLVAYISRLIKEDRVEEFYWTEDWKELRQDVLEELYYECQECLKLGKYTKADCVHHVNEVRHRPELALSKYYIDQKGNKCRQLIPLCNQCHNIKHPEKGQKRGKKERFTNEELW